MDKKDIINTEEVNGEFVTEPHVEKSVLSKVKGAFSIKTALAHPVIYGVVIGAAIATVRIAVDSMKSTDEETEEETID